jgi:PIN domain nuclease of toxin-antitoxin system
LRLLLDTNALLWVAMGHAKLGRVARRRIEDAGDVYVSAASIWEYAIKSARYRSADFGRTAQELAVESEARGYRRLDVTIEDAVEAGLLPQHHTDPFDRMLIAQATAQDLTLVTADEAFAAYDVRTLAADR